jgi:hypothetical protein
LRFVGYLEAITDQRFTERVPVRLRDRSGSQATIDLSPVPPPRMHGLPKLIASRLPGAPPPPIYLRDVGGDYWFEEIQDGVLYLQFNQVQDSLEQTLASFAGALDGLIALRRPALLIVDVRHNNGGNLGLLDPLVDVLRRFTSGEKPGRLVVISGRNTFSAAQVFLARVEHEASFRDPPREHAGRLVCSRPD